MSVALYRRYRPTRFSDLIGQEHVTAPLRHAIAAGRVNHAYLFSGPRGCGKTTSARILARTLNCANAATAEGTFRDEPCEECPSCIDLGPGGRGSLDVIEIDAASHNGVEDARELRERAAFAPARDRYKVFVIDEAHMVTSAGFNALLKIVEEPPEHVRFVFATTEPEKVIGTIRSRTHHYPFRLVGSDVLTPYLEQLCTAEGVTCEQGVLALVTRAGGGSVRDTLSVLDQLMAGAPGGQITYERAVALLGYTDSALLDEAVEALASSDGAALLGLVARVLGSGHDPRRFTEDFLERLRDLLVVACAGDSAATVLRGMPEDHVASRIRQASLFGPQQLTLSADVVHAALGTMGGASNPAIALELMMARLLLPASAGEEGLGARLERLEQGQQALAQSAPRVTAPAPAMSVPQESTRATKTPAASNEAADQPQQAAKPQQPGTQKSPVRQPESGSSEPASRGESQRDSEVRDAGAAATGGQARAAADADSAICQRDWPVILDAVASKRRTTWTALQHATVAAVNGDEVVLEFKNPGALRMFASRQSHVDVAAAVLAERLGRSVSIKAVPPGAAAGASVSAPARDATTAPPTRPSPGPETKPAHSAPHNTAHKQAAPAPRVADDQPPPPEEPAEEDAYSQPQAEGGPAFPAEATPEPAVESPRARAQAAMASARMQEPAKVEHERDPDADVSLDDPVDTGTATSSALIGVRAVEKILGGQVIDVVHQT